MNAATMLLKSVTKTKTTTPRPKGARIQDMLSAADRRELAAAGAFKLSRPMDSVTAHYLTIQWIRHRKWARWPHSKSSSGPSKPDRSASPTDLPSSRVSLPAPL